MISVANIARALAFASVAAMTASAEAAFVQWKVSDSGNGHWYKNLFINSWFKRGA